MSKKSKSIDSNSQARPTEELIKAVEAEAVEGGVTCPVLRKLAEEKGVPYSVAGAAADAAGIRIRSCDLGCF